MRSVLVETYLKCNGKNLRDILTLYDTSLRSESIQKFCVGCCVHHYAIIDQAPDHQCLTSDQKQT